MIDILLEIRADFQEIKELLNKYREINLANGK